MEKVEVATAAKGSVELLNLVCQQKTQEKDFSTQTKYIHTV